MRDNRNLEDKAILIAQRAHAGQFRRDGVTPYINHPAAVAERMTTDAEKAIAWLHDVLEDTNETPQSLAAAGMPREVVQTVLVLTRRKNEPYFDYISRIKKHPIASLVKISDLSHNLRDSPTANQVQRYSAALVELSKQLTPPITREEG